MWGGGRPSLPKICHRYCTMMKLGKVIPYLKKIKKKYESRDTPTEFCWHQQFSNGNQQILLYREIQIEITFWCISSKSFNFSWVFRCFCNKPGYNLMMSAKMATSDLLKITEFWNNDCDVIISVNDVTNKISWHNSNYIVDVLMWPKFGNSSISMKKVITTSTL